MSFQNGIINIRQIEILQHQTHDIKDHDLQYWCSHPLTTSQNILNGFQFKFAFPVKVANLFSTF